MSGLDFGSLIIATDGDGDTVTLKGKLTIEITDDIPKITSFHETGAAVTIDETAGQQSNDTTLSLVSHQFDHVTNVGHDPDMGNAPQFAFNLAPVVVGSYVSGADDFRDLSGLAADQRPALGERRGGFRPDDDGRPSHLSV